jgi:hypothetical protein
MQMAVATSSGRSPKTPPNQLPSTGPRIQPPVKAIRMTAITRLSADVGFRLSVTNRQFGFGGLWRHSV